MFYLHRGTALETCRPVINYDRRMFFFCEIDEFCVKTNFFTRNFISSTTKLTKFLKIVKIYEKRFQGLRFQKHKIRVYDFKSRILLGLTISKRDFFAKSNFLLGLTIPNAIFLQNQKSKFRVNDFKNTKLGFTILNRGFCQG